jgi:hypothetical protein
MTVSGDSLWPSAGIFMAAVVEIFVAADMEPGTVGRCP